MKHFCLATVILLLLLFPEHGVTAEAAADRPKIGLALSGGGARGGAHVGILKALEELDVPIDYIAGTSMGAIIGGLYASGYSAEEIEEILKDTDWTTALRDSPDRRYQSMRKKELDAQFLIPYRVGFNKGRFQLPLGAVEGQHLDQLFHRLFFPVVNTHDFDQLPIPFRAVATDLVTGDEVVLADGSLPDAVRASMSVPGVFSPVTIDDYLLVDGGMSNNLPVSVVREMGADIVIAVDISSPMLRADQITSILGVSEQLTNFLTRRTTDAQIKILGDKDLLIVPELGDFSSADFEGAEEIVPLGYEAAIRYSAELAALAPGVSPQAVEKPDATPSEYIVQFVDIDNGSVLNDRIIRSRVDVTPGQPLDLNALEKSVDRIYTLDMFSSVTYDLVQNEQGERGVQVNARPRGWGPNYFQFGLELSSNFSGSSEFKLGAAYTRKALNQLGGELRIVGSIGREDEISIDFYQPIDMRAKWFVEPQVYWSRENLDWWQGDQNVARYEIYSLGAKVGLGRNLRSTDRVRLDYNYANASAEVVIGEAPIGSDDDVDIGELKFEYLHDSLDSIWFPNKGMLHRLAYRYADESLGASLDYQQALASGAMAWSKDKNIFSLSYELGYSVDDAAPIERWFRLGGFGRLSGLAPDQLAGRQLASFNLAYYRRLNDVKLMPAYAGFTLEAGNVWDYSQEIGFDSLRYSGSLFIGSETPLGPVYFAWGISDNGDHAVYFYLGNPFQARRFD